jgi:hypothetical protein
MERRTSFYSTLLITVCLSTLVFNSFSQGMVYLDANNVKAGFYPGGNLFSEMVNGAIDKASYEVPKGSGIHSIYASSFWLSGLDQAGNLKGAVARYQQPTDWEAGPISTTYDALYDSIYRHVFKVSKAEIDYHRLNFGTSGYTMMNNIKSWPGNGRLAFGESAQLAPFEDKNQNGVYEPALGEYPSICGDQAVFFILNDMRAPLPNSGCPKMGVELKVLAYAFTSNDTAIDNTVFLKVAITNRSPKNYSDVYFSNFIDPDLGCLNNDRVGCDTLTNTCYAYNEPVNDVSCLVGLPGYGTLGVAQGMTVLSHKLDGFVYGINSNSSPFGDPTNCNGYRNVQESLLLNGNPVTYGGAGSIGTIATKYCFPGNPANASEWSEVNQQAGATIAPGDRRMIANLYLDQLPPGSTQTVDLAYVTSLSTTLSRYEMVTPLLRDISHVRDFYRNTLVDCGTITTNIVDKQARSNKVKIYPNPTTGNVNVSLDKMYIGDNLWVVDIQGKVLYNAPITSINTLLNLSDFTKGIYVFKIQHNGEQVIVKKIVLE